MALLPHVWVKLMLHNSLDRLSQSGESEKKLVCWDFDNTISAIHMHNTLRQHMTSLENSWAGKAFAGHCKEHYGSYLPIHALEHYEEQILTHYRTYLLSEENIRQLDSLAEKMLEIHEKGYHQAITSFTWFSQIAKPTIEFILERHLFKKHGPLSQAQQSLIQEVVSQMYVAGGFPQGGELDSPIVGGGNPGHPLRKFQHMRLAMAHFGIESRQNCCLVDDDPLNVQVAQAQGFESILADRDDAFALYLNQLNAFMRTEQEKAERDFLLHGFSGGIPRDYLSGEEPFEDDVVLVDSPANKEADGAQDANDAEDFVVGGTLESSQEGLLFAFGQLSFSHDSLEEPELGLNSSCSLEEDTDWRNQSNFLIQSH